MSEPADDDRVWTVPNVVCGLRILGLAPLLWVAWQGHRQAFLWLLVILLLSDWIDGKLAVLLEQRSAFGARLDSVADILLYAAAALGLWWLETDAVRGNLGWLAAVGASWALSAAIALLRFGRLPSYHTRGAKISWLVAGVTASVMLLTGDARPVPWALAFVVLTNLEAVAIGCTLPEWRADVPGLRQAWRIRRERREDRADERC